MAHYRATIDTPRAREDVFAYLSDFSSTQEWDPGVVEAERLGGAAVGEGTEFRLVASFLGRTTPVTYRIVEFQPPAAVTLLGENATVVSRDRITFVPLAQGTRITYDADLALKGPLKLADPLLRLAFGRVGDRALAGLRRTLAPTPAHALARLPDARWTAGPTSCWAISHSRSMCSSSRSAASSSARSTSGCWSSSGAARISPSTSCR